VIPIANPVISQAAKAAVADVLDSGQIADGEEVRAFEAAFADFVGVEHAIATSNGTTALATMLEAAGIGEDDVVLTSPLSFIASANAIQHAGADVAFADVDRETFNLDPNAVRQVLEERQDVTAILPVHLYGLPSAMDEFREIAEAYDCQLFEDAAQAHGATFRGAPVGSLADAGAFSFYATKNVTTGEGGMITTDDADLAERARHLVDHGRTAGDEHAVVGYNRRMTNVAAAIGRDQLERLPRWVETRQEHADRLTTTLRDVDGVEPPSTPDDRTHAFHQYTVRTTRRDVLEAGLGDAGVGHEIYYPRPIPGQPAYADADPDVPVARDCSEEVLSLPVHPQLEPGDIEIVTEAVANTLRDHP
jgi:dTDP-4-amino-4,6-dideoxygalactose transaminase